MTDAADTVAASAYELGIPLETERMTLRELRPDDGEDIHAIYSHAEVNRYLYSEPMDLEASRRYALERSNPVVLAGDPGVNIAGELRETGRVVATFFIRVASTTHRSGEIGYVVGPAYAGRGLASEGALAMLSLGFESWDMHRMIGRCDARNHASAAVLRRVGLRQEALFRENEWVKGEWTDELVFAMLAEEWQAGGKTRG